PPTCGPTSRATTGTSGSPPRRHGATRRAPPPSPTSPPRTGPPRRRPHSPPEYGIPAPLPQYSGGLGILAGDHLKAASDLGVPIVGVGLLYRSGYFGQSRRADGGQAEHSPSLDPQGLPLRLLAEPVSGAPVLLHVAMPGN